MFSDESEIPKWLNEEYFDKVIRSYEKDECAKVKSFQVVSASKVGENMLSNLYKCKITYASKYNISNELSVVIKIAPQEGIKKIFLENAQVFETEMCMYGETLPEFKTLWEGAGDESSLNPKLIYQSEEPTDTIILEDLSSFGYTIIDKPPEDYNESKLIVQKLAKFHAASYFQANEKNMDFKGTYNDSMFKKTNTMLLDKLFKEGIEVFSDVVLEWPGFEQYSLKLKEFSKHYQEKALRTYSPNGANGYNVLNHGDFHNKNILVSKKDRKIDNLYFIDFQICIYASPAIDLLYALYYCLSSENRQTHRNDFISYYHQEFTYALKSYGYLKAIPTLLDLQIELLKNGNLEVLLLLCCISFFYVDWAEINVPNYDGVAYKKKVFNKEEYKAIIQQELPRFFFNGLV